MSNDTPKPAESGPLDLEVSHMSPEMLRLSSKLKELCELETNWDGYGAGPVSTIAAFLALGIAGRLEEMFPQGWQAVPGPGGEVQLEIHSKQLDLEIMVVAHKVDED